MITTLSLALLFSAQPAFALPRNCRSRDCFRARGSSDGESFAFFEFAPASGTGMTAACACTNPTGARGEVLTFARASSGACLKGNTTTAIADGDLVICSSGQPRVMPGGDGTGSLGLLMEGSRTNTCLRSAELCNAAWADVGTPTCTSDSAAGPLGTTTMDLLDDNDGAGFEGRIQNITTTSATQHSVSCFVKAGTATSASIVLAGTGSASGDCTGTATGLSSTTSTRVTCTSPAVYAGTLTAVDVTIRVGTVAGDTGTILVEGCQHEVNGTQVSSYIATTGASATRAIESNSFPVSLGNSTGSVAMTWLPGAALPCGNIGDCGGVALSAAGPSYRQLTFWAQGTFLASYLSSAGGNATRSWAPSAGTAARISSWWDASNVAIIVNGTQTTAAAGTYNATTLVELGTYNGTRPNNSVIKQVCVDPTPTRCR